ncbi:MAG: HAD hydrolase-like protein [Chitinophagaceae bacterium]|nr:HAD hydrolase-like protein [Oligoflexus sp.]
MEHPNAVSCVFLDIGGVLLSDGWGHESRHLATKTFNLDQKEFEHRHSQAFDTHQLGNMTLEAYLDLVVFYRPRSFTHLQFRDFMFAQSTPNPLMIKHFQGLKKKFGLKIFVVSNEGRELNAYRLAKFELNSFVDTYVSSCYVHINKPNRSIFQLALDLSQVAVDQIVYVENTAMYVEIARTMGIKSILHNNYTETCRELALFGLSLNEGDNQGLNSRRWSSPAQTL